jgi:putative ATP-binding cassette transporter
MKLLRVLLRYSRAMVLLAIVAGVASGAATTALLGVLNRAISQLGKGSAPQELLLPFLGLAVASAAAKILSGYALDRFGQQAVFELRMNLIESILSSPLSRLESVGSHRLMTALTGDLTSVLMALKQVSSLAVHGTIVTGGLIYLGILSWKLLAALLCMLPLGLAAYRLPMRAGMRRQRDLRLLSETLFTHYQGACEGTKELKLNRARRRSFLERLEQTGRLFQRLRIEMLSLLRIAGTWGQLALFLIMGVLLFALPRWLALPSEAVSGAALVLLYMGNSLQVLLDHVPDLGQASVAIERLDQLGLSLTQEGTDLGTVLVHPAVEGAVIELRRVRYEYPAEDGQEGFAVGPIDLRVCPGELVFLTGGNGSGKTTLAKLITGLYLPSEGEIRLNGRPITDEAREWYRQHVSAVFSDFFLFRELLGFEQTPEVAATVRELLKRLQLNHKVEVEDGTFSTLKLSQGQRKRLALLTAWLEDRPVILFDEWAADQDPHFKEFFYNVLLAQLRALGKTVVVISHDDRYYGVADRVVVLEGGRVREVRDGVPAPALADAGPALPWPREAHLKRGGAR